MFFILCFSTSDDNLLKNIELFDKLSLRFSGRVLFIKDVIGSSEICCWSFYGHGKKVAEVCCTSIVYATDKKHTKVLSLLNISILPLLLWLDKLNFYKTILCKLLGINVNIKLLYLITYSQVVLNREASVLQLINNINRFCSTLSLGWISRSSYLWRNSEYFTVWEPYWTWPRINAGNIHQRSCNGNVILH